MMNLYNYGKKGEIKVKGMTDIKKDIKKIDTLPAELRRHYEDSMRHNQELMKRLAHL